MAQNTVFSRQIGVFDGVVFWTLSVSSASVDVLSMLEWAVSHAVSLEDGARPRAWFVDVPNSLRCFWIDSDIGRW